MVKEDTVEKGVVAATEDLRDRIAGKILKIKRFNNTRGKTVKNYLMCRRFNCSVYEIHQ